MTRNLLVAALAGAGVACGPVATVVVPAQYDARYVRHADAAPGCPVVLDAFTDRRPDPTYVGMFSGKPVRAEDFASWLRGGIEARLAPGTGAAGAPVALDVEVVKAYMTHQGTSIAASLVVRATLSREGLAGEPKLYRGASTGINWAGDESEVMVELSGALNRVMDQVQADALALCAAAPAQTSQKAD